MDSERMSQFGRRLVLTADASADFRRSADLISLVRRHAAAGESVTARAVISRPDLAPSEACLKRRAHIRRARNHRHRARCVLKLLTLMSPVRLLTNKRPPSSAFVDICRASCDAPMDLAAHRPCMHQPTVRLEGDRQAAGPLPAPTSGRRASETERGRAQERSRAPARAVLLVPGQGHIEEIPDRDTELDRLPHIVRHQVQSRRGDHQDDFARQDRGQQDSGE